MNAELVYAKMEASGAGVNIVILDACRNNPLPGADRSTERGLAVVGNVQPPKSVIIYSTAPGRTAADGEGRNGTFTEALLCNIATPDLDIELMMRRVREEVIQASGGSQVPWQNSSLTGSGFAFAKGGGAMASPSVAQAAQPSAQKGQKGSVSGIISAPDPRPVATTAAARPATAPLAYLAFDPLGFLELGPGLELGIPLSPSLYLAPHIRWSYLGLLYKTIVVATTDGVATVTPSCFSVGGALIALGKPVAAGRWFGGVSLDYIHTDEDIDLGASDERHALTTTFSVMGEVGYRWASRSSFFVDLGVLGGYGFSMGSSWWYLATPSDVHQSSPGDGATAMIRNCQ